MRRTFLVIAASVLLLSACGAMAERAPATQAPAAPAVDAYGVGGAAVEAPAPAGFSDSSANSSEGAAGAPDHRIVLQDANLTIVVKDPQAKMAELTKLAEDMGGYVVSSQLYQTSAQNGAEAPGANVVIRVPSDQLEVALTAIKKDVVEVQNETRSGQDVTKDYIDQQSQLRNLQAAEAQLTQIMQQATKTQDVLDVFNQLTAIRSQIEVVKGQIQYYDEASRLSAVTVQIVAEATVKPLEVAGWKPQGVARDAIQALINFSQGFVNFLIWLVLFLLPAGILIFLPLWLIWRGLRALLRRNRAAKTPTPPAA